MIDIESHTGGQAASVPLDEQKHGASLLNDGVQCGSAIFRHTFRLFRRYGFEPQPVKLQVSFGKGKNNFRTNVFPSPLVGQHSRGIKKVDSVLKCIKYTMPILGILPVKFILRLFRFSGDFNNKMVLSLLALFLGTGNQTPNVSSVLLERLFDGPQMKLWEYDPDTLLPNLPTMYTFPNPGDFYQAWAKELRAKGVDICLHSSVAILERGKTGMVLQFQRQVNDGEQPESGYSPETFDELVLCCPADEAKRMLGQNATWSEKYVLGGVKFFNDITITHSDADYFQKIFEAQYDPALCAEATTKDRKEQINFAEQQPRCEKDSWQGSRPMYFTHSFESDSDKIETGFDCSNY